MLLKFDNLKTKKKTKLIFRNIIEEEERKVYESVFK